MKLIHLFSVLFLLTQACHAAAPFRADLWMVGSLCQGDHPWPFDPKLKPGSATLEYDGHGNGPYPAIVLTNYTGSNYVRYATNDSFASREVGFHARYPETCAVHDPDWEIAKWYLKGNYSDSITFSVTNIVKMPKGWTFIDLTMRPSVFDGSDGAYLNILDATGGVPPGFPVGPPSNRIDPITNPDLKPPQFPKPVEDEFLLYPPNTLVTISVITNLSSYAYNSTNGIATTNVVTDEYGYANIVVNLPNETNNCPLLFFNHTVLRSAP